MNESDGIKYKHKYLCENNIQMETVELGLENALEIHMK